MPYPGWSPKEIRILKAFVEVERGLWKPIVISEAGKAAQRAGVQRGKALGHYRKKVS